jgi:hypothetical protein
VEQQHEPTVPADLGALQRQRRFRRQDDPGADRFHTQLDAEKIDCVDRDGTKSENNDGDDVTHENLLRTCRDCSWIETDRGDAH